MADQIVETNSLPVAGTYDVIVAGGGIAGVSAALAARRCGCRVLLIEKSVMLGGLATLGLVAYYNPPLCDRKGRKLVSGIAEELLHLSIAYGYDSLPDDWKSKPQRIEGSARYSTVFSPPAFVVALDELMEKEGIEVLFDTVCCRSFMSISTCEAIVVENKTGRSCYTAKAFVDTTGDADLMVRSGVECVEDDNWLSFWACSTSVPLMRKAAESSRVRDGIKLEGLGARQDGTNAPPGSRKYRILDAFEISRFVIDGRKLVRERMRSANRDEEAFVCLPGMPQFRTTRRIAGLYTLTEKDRDAHCEDSVGCAAEERAPYHILEIPYRTLVSPGARNIITAGRTISSTGSARELTRLIAVSSLTGQAAGTAAWLATQRQGGFAGLSVGDLQEKLRADGVLLHF